VWKIPSSHGQEAVNVHKLDDMGEEAASSSCSVEKATGVRNAINNVFKKLREEIKIEMEYFSNDIEVFAVLC